MKMRTKFRAARYYFDDPVPQLLGIERANPDPLDRTSLGDHFEQAGQFHLRLEVLAITAEMHPGQNDFLEAARMQIVERRYHAARLDAPRSSARKRHDAEGTELIASFLEFQKRARVTVQRHGGQLYRRFLLA